MCVCVSFGSYCPEAKPTHTCTDTHAPVLQLLAVDAHGPLVALGDTHLVPAALHLLAGVLGGVDVWSGGGKTNQKAR